MTSVCKTETGGKGQTLIVSARPEVREACGGDPVGLFSEVKPGAVLPVCGLVCGLAVEDLEGGIHGIWVACYDLDAVWVDCANTGEDDVAGGVEEGGGGEVEDGSEEEGVDEDVGEGDDAGLCGEAEAEGGDEVWAADAEAFASEFWVGLESCEEMEGVECGDGEADQPGRDLRGVSAEEGEREKTYDLEKDIGKKAEEGGRDGLSVRVHAAFHTLPPNDNLCLACTNNPWRSSSSTPSAATGLPRHLWLTMLFLFLQRMVSSSIWSKQHRRSMRQRW